MDGYFQALAKLDYPSNKLIINILDNHPEHRSYQYIINNKFINDSFPFKVILEKSTKNLGFTGGNNFVMKRILRESHAKYCFLLNIDTEIDSGCIKKLSQVAINDESLGMLEAIQQPKEHPKYYDPETLETGWCSGGGVLISTKALRQVGLFDDRFFLYCEDVDLSWRMWLNGWKCKVEPQATYLHFTESQDEQKDQSVQQYYSVRNSLYMHYKYDSRDGILKHKHLIQDAITKQSDQKSKNALERAYKDASKDWWRFMADRLKRPFLGSSKWILFNEFAFERRRDFIDTEDGRRVIL